jgi:hypothetical protein
MFEGIIPRGRRTTNTAAYNAKTGFLNEAMRIAAAGRVPATTNGE